MIFNYKGKLYSLQLSHKIIPQSLVQIVRRFNNEPIDDTLVINGNRLAGKVALVTGAHKGIGYAIAKRLLQDGAKVIITGRNEEQLNKSVEKLNTHNVSYIKWDISDTDKCADYFLKAIRIYGTIDILVNNAGVTTDRKTRVPFEAMDKKHIHYVHDINTIGTRRMCIEYANNSTCGTILNIISNTGVRPAQDAYFTSKWALYSFTKMYGNECFNNGKRITVNGLCPGPIKTDMSFGPSSTILRTEIPNRRIGLSEEIAELAFTQIISGLEGVNAMITVCDGGETLN